MGGWGTSDPPWGWGEVKERPDVVTTTDTLVQHVKIYNCAKYLAKWNFLNYIGIFHWDLCLID